MDGGSLSARGCERPHRRPMTHPTWLLSEALQSSTSLAFCRCMSPMASVTLVPVRMPGFFYRPGSTKLPYQNMPGRAQIRGLGPTNWLTFVFCYVSLSVG